MHGMKIKKENNKNIKKIKIKKNKTKKVTIKGIRRKKEAKLVLYHFSDPVII